MLLKDLKDLKIDRDWTSFLEFRERKLNGLQTGIRSLDRSLLGLGGITLIQGAPGCNKSTLALQIVQHNAVLGTPALIIDRENGFERFRMRLLCQANRVSQTDVMTMSKERLHGLAETINDYPIFVETEPVETYQEISAYIQSVWDEYQRPIVLVVDSLQALPLIASEERLSLQKWMGLFDQAKLDWEGKLHIIITSEKSRGEGGANYERSNLGASKGAGGIEYKAEMVLDLRRNRENGNIICDVVKNRDGMTGISVELVPALAVAGNAQSFCFRLEDGGSSGGLF